MIKDGYKLENKDKDILLAIKEYCKSVKYCDECIFDKTSGCTINEVKCRICEKVNNTLFELNRQIKEYQMENA